tara:strand:+ start:190 stop:501 length:312 start_codon:yes stop_codon:yes gene_type:complete
MTKISTKIATTCEDIKTLLLEKNAKYGNSAVEPISIFSKQDNAAAICARIDDKLSRIKNVGLNDATEDTLDDLIGYLVLLKIARGESNRAQKNIKIDLEGVTC